MSDPAVQWVATTLFGALSVYSLWRLMTSRHPLAGTGHLFHLGMNLVMVAMVWPWWARLPTLPQVAFFVAGAAGFAAAAGWYGLDAPSRGRTPDGRRAGHHESARCQATHAVMMLAMVWALAVMTRHGGHAAAHVAEHAAAAVPLDAPTAAAGAVLAVLLVVGGALFLVAAVRHARGGDRVGLDRAGLDLLTGGLMSLGTAAMCGLMLAG